MVISEIPALLQCEGRRTQMKKVEQMARFENNLLYVFLYLKLNQWQDTKAIVVA